MITAQERAKLKSLANSLRDLVYLGKEGLTENVIEQVKMDFSNKELVKVKVLPNCGNIVAECLNEVALATKSEPVCKIGNYFVLYKVNNKKGYKHILAND